MMPRLADGAAAASGQGLTEILDKLRRHPRTPAEGHTSWPVFDHASQKLLSLQPEGSKVTTDFASDHKCGFWASTK